MGSFPGYAPQLSLGKENATKLGMLMPTAPYLSPATALSSAAASVSGGETMVQDRLPQHLNHSI